MVQIRSKIKVKQIDQCFRKLQKKAFLDQYDFLSKNFGRSLTLNKKVQSCTNSIEKQKLQWKQSNVPVSIQQVFLHYSHYLTKDQKIQIKQYKQVYYIGHKIKKRQQIGLEFPNYDTQDKQYRYTIGDHIAYRYQLIQFLGKGSYGQVFKVFDHKKKQYQALKIIKNKKKITKQAYIQINILLAIKQHDRQRISGIVNIKDFVQFRKHVCILFELLSQNLYQLIKKNDYNGLEIELIRRFAIQILTSLTFLKQHKIIHCDLKPENILLKQSNKSGIKIIDFGSSCFQNQIIYSYIQSRYYRAPEITLNIKYDSMIDMWSFGCILVQLYIGAPLFPGQNQFQQMAYMIGTLGLPPSKFVNMGERKKVFFYQDMTLKQDLKNAKLTHGFGRPLRQIISQKDKLFLEFIQSILKWEPQSRITPQQALRSKWILEGIPQQVKTNHKIFNQEPKDKRNSKIINEIKQKKKSKSKQKQILIQSKSKSNKSKSRSKQTSLKIKQAFKHEEDSKQQHDSIPLKIKLNVSTKLKSLKGQMEPQINVKIQHNLKQKKQFNK